MSDTLHSDRTVLGNCLPPEDRFASAWETGSAPPLTEFLPQEGDEGYLVTLERLVQIEIEQSWRRAKQDGSTPQRLEEYLKRFPVLRTPDAILRLAKAEFIARSHSGDTPEPGSYSERFPDYISVDCASAWLAEAHTAAEAKPGPAADLGMLGDYRLLEQVGEGGMGVVYRALQPGANRVVALKVIRSSMTGAGESFRKKAESRFKNEIHAAAQLEHENIVPVYDVGAVGDLMYFAMRFVEGKSLSDLVKQGPLENRLAAQYLVGTAKGVAEAHRRGILHRDLKPHNVMIESRTGRPMVADFGLAKVLDAEDHITRTGEAIGTPSYMPPEQIGDAARVDARGDVYSLGATLYHVLTGRPPFQAANTLGTMRQVLYDEAAPPRRLNSAVDADLDTICLKCLQKEPVRRYQSAAELVEDLERYLRGEAILARPIGRLERLNRWRKRNPLEAGLTAAAILLAGTALAATTIGYRNTRAALDQAERNLGFAREAVDELYTEVSELDLENQPGLQPLKRKLLTRALEYYQKFLEDNRGDESMTAELADNYFRVGTITEELGGLEASLPHFARAADIEQQLLVRKPNDAGLLERLSDALNSIGRVEQRRQNFPAAAEAYRKSRELRTKLAETAPDDRGYRRKLANVVMNGGLLEARQGRFEPAASAYREAQRIREELLAKEFDEPVARDFARGAFNLGALLLDHERLEEAAPQFADAVEWFERLVEANPQSLKDRFDLSVALTLQGDVFALKSEVTSAFDTYTKAREQLQSLADESPRVVGYQERLATVAIAEGRLHFQLGLNADAARDVGSRHLSQSRSLLDTAVRALEMAIATDPDRAGPRHDLAVAHQLRADVFDTEGNPAAAKAARAAGLKALEPLQPRFQQNPDCEALWRELQASLSAAVPSN